MSYFDTVFNFGQLFHQFFTNMSPIYAKSFSGDPGVIGKVTLSSPSLSLPYPLCFHPLSPLSVVSAKE